MTVYYVDDGGSATDPYDTWAKAATSLSALDDAKTLASGDIIYIGHDHVCQFTHSANRTITGPSSGKPCIIISATQGSDPPTYQQSSTNQIDTSEGAYYINFSGCFSLYGIRVKSGSIVYLTPDLDTSIFASQCTFLPASNSYVGNGNSFSNCGGITLRECTIDCSADSGSQSGTILGDATMFSEVAVIDCVFANCGNRTGMLVDANHGMRFSGCDMSSLTSNCEWAYGRGRAEFTNCLSAASWTPYLTAYTSAACLITNCGPEDAPTYSYHATYYGASASSTAIYRTGGAAVEGVSCAWLVTTNTNCTEGSPYFTPFIYGTVSSTGSRTFNLYITNDTADFTDAEVWLEIESLSTSDEATWALATDQRATITTTAAAQTDDTTSTWNGTGPSFTYKQKLSVTATVNETGQYRARVAVGVASIAGSRYFYADPKVTVS